VSIRRAGRHTIIVLVVQANEPAVGIPIAISTRAIFKSTSLRSKTMRALLVIVALIVICALVGWISFSDGPGRTSINLETNEIREDTNQVMRSGAELLHKAGDKVEADTNRQNQQAPPVQNESVPASGNR
jgi:hypothetical protein